MTLGAIVSLVTLPATGLVHGKTITLDAPVPPLEGKRVWIVLEALDAPEVAVSADPLASAWQEWAAGGPQGPLDDEDDFPDAAR